MAAASTESTLTLLALPEVRRLLACVRARVRVRRVR